MEEFYQLLQEELAKLIKSSLYRQVTLAESPGDARITIGGREYINLASNNYLGLANHPVLKEKALAALQQFGTGATASRLVVGTLPLHEQVEDALRRFQATESTLLFNSGYNVNSGVIPSIVGRNDQIFSDKLNHASIIDGITLSKSQVWRFRHNDLDHLESLLAKNKTAAGQKLIITESIFSMDGDQAPLKELAALKKKYGAILMVDEAHSEGVLGPKGRGLAALLDVHQDVDIHIGTLSKGFGCFGGYVSGRKVLIDYLRNKCRSFIYTTALPPAILGSILGAIEVIESEEGEKRRRILQEKSSWLRGELVQLGYNTLNCQSHIIPILVPGNEQAIAFGQRLREKGILALPMRYPTVPKNSERIRLNLIATHTEEDLALVLEELTQLKDMIPTRKERFI